MSRLPAEWEHQSGVQLTWPHCDTEWYGLEKVLECYVEIAYNILRFEPLMIVTRDIDECKADIVRISQRKGIEIDLDAIRFKGYAFQIEMKFVTYKCGFTIKEVPVIFVNRVLGVSKMSGGIFSEAFFGVISLKIGSWFKRYPQKGA